MRYKLLGLLAALGLLAPHSAAAGWLDFFNTPANKVIAGPSSGGAGTAVARSLVGADLPNPSATTLGGTESKSCSASNWLSSISTSGVPACTQPSFADLSSTLNLATQVSGILANANTTAASANTASAIVARDGSGNFSAGTITASLTGNVTGTVTGHSTLDLPLTGGTMTGNIQIPAGASGTPSLNFTTALTSGLYAPAANSLGFSANGAYAGMVDSSGRWQVGVAGAVYPIASGPFTSRAVNYQMLLQNSSMTANAGSVFALDWDAAGGGTFTMNPAPGNGNKTLQGNVNKDAWGINGVTNKAAFSVNASTTDTTTTNLANAGSSFGCKQTSTTAGNYCGHNFIDDNDVAVAGILGKFVTHSATVPDVQLDLITNNGGTKTRALSLLKTGQPQFPFFAAAGALVNNSSGTVSTVAMSDGKLLIGSTASGPAAANLTAGAGISITNGSNTITITASGTPAANLLTKTADYTLTATDNVIIANCSTACTQTLESAVVAGSGATHTIKRIGSATVSIATTSSQTIDGDTSAALTDPYVSLTVISDGSNWYVP